MTPKINLEYQNEDGSFHEEGVKKMFYEVFHNKVAERRVIVSTSATGVLSKDDETFVKLVINPDVKIYGSEEDLKQIQARYERINRDTTT